MARRLSKGARLALMAPACLGAWALVALALAAGRLP